jgi:membrane-bound serine protease (ClpP class)
MAPSKTNLAERCERESRQLAVRLRAAKGITISITLALAGVMAFVAAPVFAQNPAGARARENSGGFVIVRSPITSATEKSVERQCDKLLKAGARIIVFEFQPGTSDYGNCLNLARFIEGTTGAKTVAYVHEPLYGHAVMPALAADELVVSRKAEIGDIGRDDKVILPGTEAEYRELARRRKPAYQAVILGMLDKKYQVWKVVTARDTRFVLDDDLQKLETEEQIKNKEVLIMPGQLGNFSGDQLRQMGLAQLTAESRAEVAELYGMPPKSAVDTVESDVDWRPVLIRIEGTVNLLMHEYVVRHVKEAREDGRNFFIFEINSFGGELASGLDLAERIRDMKGVKTIAYIPERAISAAAIIALGCDEIIMHAEAQLGDCGVMFRDKNDQFHYAPEKVLSILLPSLDSLAKAKGYPPALVRGMVQKDLVVREVLDKRTGRIVFMSDEEIQNRDMTGFEVRRIVKDKDNFLTVPGHVAVTLDLARDQVDNLDGLKAIYGLEEKNMLVMTPSWVDTLIVVLNSWPVTVILIVGGILGLYTELKMPGVLLPGVIAGLCFLLFFWSHVMGGTATALEVVLFLAGILCLGVEILLIPGFGVVGVTGILLIISSLILASQTFVFPQGPSEWKQFTLSMLPLLIAVMSLGAFAALISKYLPHVPIIGGMVLQPDFSQGEGAGQVAASPFDELMGTRGVTMTMLRPAGLVRFGDQYIDVVSDGGYINEGAEVQVIEVTGNRIVVKQVS